MVYLIHFEQKYKHAQHYIGYCSERGLVARLERHRNGTGANLLRVLNEAGIPYDVVRKWKKKGRDFERHLKDIKNAKRYCPICQKQKQ